MSVRRVEDILPMLPRALAVIDDERRYDVPRAGFSVGNVFAPKTAPGAVAIKARAGVTAIGAAMSESPVGLVSNMFGRGERHPGRANERRERASLPQKSDRLVKRGQTFTRPQKRTAR